MYDAETGLYYLQSRYYDPNTGRFISADSTDYLGANETVISYNLFAYCGNDPVINIDKSGKIFMNAILGGIFGAVLSGVIYYIEYQLGMRSWNWWTFAGNVALDATLGALGGYISGYAKFAKVAKHARLPKMLKKLKSPIVRNLVVWSEKGISYIIKKFVKSLSRKQGESWPKAVSRILGI